MADPYSQFDTQREGDPYAQFDTQAESPDLDKMFKDPLWRDYLMLKPIGTEGDVAKRLEKKYGVTAEQLETAASGHPLRESPVEKLQEKVAHAVSKPVQIAVTGATAVLKPLQVPQQAAFATVLGVEKTIKEGNVTHIGGNIANAAKQVDWTGYLPWQQVNSDISFKDVLAEGGVKNKAVLRFGGALGDLVVDPLLLGGALTAAGKIAKVGSLVKLGDKVTELTSPVGIAKAVAAPLPKAAKEAAKNFAVKSVNRVLDMEVPQKLTPHTSRRVTVGQMVFAHGENPLKPGAGPYEGGAGRVRDVLKIQHGAARNGEEALNFVSDKIDNLKAALGEPTVKTIYQNVGNVVKKVAKIPERASMFKTETQNTISALTFDTVDHQGVLANEAALEGLKKLPLYRPNEAESIGHELQDIQGLMGKEALKQARQGGQDVFEQNLAKVRKVASQAGDDPGAAEDAFRDMVQQTLEGDAAIGYHTSLWGPAKESVYQNVAMLGGNAETADRLLSGIVNHSLDGTFKKWLDTPTDLVPNAKTVKMLPMQEALAKRSPPPPASAFLRNPNRVEATSIKPLTVGEVLDNSQGLMQILDWPAYINGLVHGHLRRTYGIFQTAESSKKFAKAVESGNLLVSKIVTPEAVTQTVKDGGAAKLINRYMESVSPTVPGERGVVVRQANLLKHLTENGLTPKEAKTAIGDLIRGVNPQVANLVKDVNTYIDDKTPLLAEKIRVGNKQVAAEREDLSDGILEMLGQLAEPSVSLAESAKAMLGNQPLYEVLADVFNLGREKSLVIPDTGQVVEGFERVPKQKAYGSFAGKLVDKTLKREVDNLFATASEFRPKAYGRIVSLIKQGYLANPATTLANVVGNLFISTLHGENPFQLLKVKAGVAKDWAKLGHELPELKEFGDVLAGSLSVNSQLAKHFDLGKVEQSGMELGFGGKMRQWGRAYQEFLHAPLGQTEGKTKMGRFYNTVSSALGLNAFQYDENLTKLAVARIHKAAGETSEQAARAARNVVFDYSALPEVMQMIRQTGLILFPGFHTFLAGRVLNAALHRPGVLASADRLGDVVWETALPNDDTRYAAYASLADWEKQGGYMPIRMLGGIVHITPLQSLISTNAFTGGPFLSSVESGGIYEPLLDVGYALSAQGEEFGRRFPTNQEYGTYVFNPFAPTANKVAQIGEYFYNTLAPGFARKQFSFGYAGERAEGLIPALARSILSPPKTVGDTYLTAHEALRRKQNKTLFDAAASVILPSVRPLSLRPATSDLNREMTSDLAALGDEKGLINRQIAEAQQAGDKAEVQRLQARLLQDQLKFINKYRSRFSYLQKYLQENP